MTPIGIEDSLILYSAGRKADSLFRKWGERMGQLKACGSLVGPREVNYLLAAIAYRFAGVNPLRGVLHCFVGGRRA